MSADEDSSSKQVSSQLDEPSLSSNEGKNSRHSYTINCLERKEHRLAAPRVPKKLQVSFVKIKRDSKTGGSRSSSSSL